MKKAVPEATKVGMVWKAAKEAVPEVTKVGMVRKPQRRRFRWSGWIQR